MIATASLPMPPPRSEFSPRRRVARWLLPAALLALMPKCVLCVLAYVGLGAAFGLGGRELCGGSVATAPVTWTIAFTWLAAATGLGALGILLGCFRRSTAGKQIVHPKECC